MSRRKPGSPSFFFILVLVVLVFLLVQHSYRSHRIPLRSSATPSNSKPRFYRDEQQLRGEKNGRRSEPIACGALGIKCDSSYFQQWQTPAENACSTKMRNGYPVPDAGCTPGGIDASVTAEVLRDPAWRTACIRNCQVSEAEKHVTYKWYGIRKPRANSGENQVCELDHLVPLELGGADGLENIWPECGGSPGAGTYRVSVKRSTGIGSRYFHDSIREGDLLQVSAPRGGFTLAPGNNPVVLLSAGIGATPVLAMLHSLAVPSIGSIREVWWCYGTRNGREH